MKRLLLGFLVLAGIAAAGQQPKTIKDRAEYNAYMFALNMPDASARAAGMESFANTYPHSVVLGDALEQAMAAYQQAGNVAKVEAIARRIMDVEPSNVRALAILVMLDRAKATSGNGDAVSEVCGYAMEGTGFFPVAQVPSRSGIPASVTSPTGDGQLHGVPASAQVPSTDGIPASVTSPTSHGQLHGVPASVVSFKSPVPGAVFPKPDGMSDSDFQKLQNQMAVIFYGGLGFCHLQNKDFIGARDAYTKAFQIDPTDLQNAYQLAIADLEMTPIDMNGVWYCSKAIHLAEGQNKTVSVNSIVPYCKAKYKKYHGGVDGWDQIVQSSTSQAALPVNFASSIKPARTPCEIAVDAVQQNDLGSFSFSDREFVLSKATCSPANKEAADKVWQSILSLEKFGDARLQVPVKIIAVATDSLDCALSDENKEAGKVDLHVMMEKPMLRPPAVGSEVNVIGVIKAYNTEPFLFVMDKGSVAAAK